MYVFDVLNHFMLYWVFIPLGLNLFTEGLKYIKSFHNLYTDFKNINHVPTIARHSVRSKETNTYLYLGT